MSCQFVFVSIFSSTLFCLFLCTNEKNWDLVYLLKKERDISLTDQFTIQLKSSTDYSKMFLTTKTLFLDNMLPINFVIFMKLKFLNRLKSAGTIFSITDPDNENRLVLTLRSSPGVIDKIALNIIFHPLNGEMVNRDILLPFAKHVTWTFALSINNDKIIVYTVCEDTKRPLGYQMITIKPQTNESYFKDGAILNLFHAGNELNKLKGEIFELIFSNSLENLQLLCPKPMIEGSGNKKRIMENKKIGNVLLNPDEDQLDSNDDENGVLSDEIITTLKSDSRNTTIVQYESHNTAQITRQSEKIGVEQSTEIKRTQSEISETPISRTDQTMVQTHETTEATTSIPTSSGESVSLDRNKSTMVEILTPTNQIVNVTVIPINHPATELIDKTKIQSLGSNDIESATTLIPDKNDTLKKIDQQDIINNITEKPLITTFNVVSTMTQKYRSTTKSDNTADTVEDRAKLKAQTSIEITTKPTIYNDVSLSPKLSSSLKPVVNSTLEIQKESISRNNSDSIIEENLNKTKPLLPVMISDKEYKRCRALMDQLLSPDNCEDMKKLRMTMPKPSEKGAKGARGERGERGEKGNIGPSGIPGTCNKTLCQTINDFKSQKGDKGDQGVCNAVSCTTIKGERGDPGQNGEPGIKGEMGSQNDINFELIKHLVTTLLPTEMEGIMKNIKGEKGDSGECKSDVQKSKKYINGQKPEFQENVNIGYGSLVFENRESLEKVSFHLPLGSMVFLLKSDTFLVKVDHLNNIWRSIGLESRSKDWILPVLQTTPKMESQRPLYINGIYKKLYLVALAAPTTGDLKSTSYQPGGYSGAAFQCQQNGDIYGYGRMMHPLINTDMFNMKYVINDMYKNIPIYNSRDQLVASDFQSLLSIKEDLQGEILDFDRRSISDNIMASCVWIGKDPVPEYRDYQQNAELKCNNWMTRHPISNALVSMISQLKPLLSDENLKSRACSLQCHILCIQTEPHLQ